MAIVLILVVLWGVVLIPTVLRKLQSRGSHQSIDSFHRSLHLLESSGPKIVQPAYRLASGDSMSVPVVARPAAIDVTPRPQLVLLRPPGQGGEETMHDFDEDYVEDYYEEDYDRPRRRTAPSIRPTSTTGLPGRSAAAQRRRKILLALGGTVIVTALGGFVISFLWDLMVVAIIALAAYVGLMAWAATHDMAGAAPNRVIERHIAHATAFDEEYDEYEDDEWYDDRPATRAHYDVFDERDRAPGVFDAAEEWADHDEQWWDQPRRAATR
jgi:hypothetical protein